MQTTRVFNCFKNEIFKQNWKCVSSFFTVGRKWKYRIIFFQQDETQKEKEKEKVKEKVKEKENENCRFHELQNVWVSFKQLGVGQKINPSKKIVK